MSLWKAALQSALFASAKGRTEGLSSFGLLLERFGAYARFATLELRQQAKFSTRPPLSVHDGSSAPRNELVFDIGANNGDDAEFYLKKGFRVVAVEANPTLARHLMARYAKEIDAGRVTVLNLAVVDDNRSEIDFFVHESNDKIGTTLKPLTGRPLFCPIRVKADRLPHLIERYGIPHYIKIDVEGADAAILSDLFDAGFRPSFISAEAHSIQVLTCLTSAGYERFKIVEGRFVHFPYFQGKYKDTRGLDFSHTFPKGNAAGPFGDDIPGPWLNADQVFEYLTVYGLGWKDIHASHNDSTRA